MRVLLASLTLLLVAACGFQPMYAPPGGGPAIGPIQVSMIEGKAGHVLRTELDRILAVENNGAPPLMQRIRRPFALASGSESARSNGVLAR